MDKMDVDLEEAVRSNPLGCGDNETVRPVMSSIMAGPSTGPSVTISLHPLVVMSISDHWTRVSAQANDFSLQVYGALIGKQKGRNIEVMDSFELKTDTFGGDIIINLEYYNKKELQFKQVASELDFIGWYTTGIYPMERDIKIQKQIANINECPIMLQVDPRAPNVEHLPVKFFESVIDILEGEPTMLFVPLTYTLATEEAERIGVDHVARMSTNESGEKSVVAEYLVAQDSAIKMLAKRILIVLKYIKEVEGRTLSANQDIIREIYALSHRLPVMQGPTFKENFYSQCNDVALICYLSTMTKGCNDMNQFINKFNVLYDRQSSGRRMRGLYY